MQIGQFGKTLTITTIIYDKLNNSKVLVKRNDTTLRVTVMMKRITTHDTFHGVQITVPGIKCTFPLLFTLKEDFSKYTVEACNDVGCNEFNIKVKSESK